MTMESMYEYGSRAGVWRILREFEQRQLPLTVFAVGMAMQRYPELCAAFMEQGHEIANHGLRWIHYQNLPEATERRHMGLATHVLKDMTGGAWPAGWYTGRDSPQHPPPAGRPGRLRIRKRLLRRRPAVLVPGQKDRRHAGAAAGGALLAGHQRHALRAGQCATTPASSSSSTCATAFDALYAEGDPAGLDRPKMMSIGMHCRLLGQARPHRRAAALPRPHPAPRPGVDPAPHRHRPALAQHPSLRPRPRPFVWG